MSRKTTKFSRKRQASGGAYIRNSFIAPILKCRPCHMFVHSKANSTSEFLPQEIGSTTFPTFNQVHYLKSAEKEFSMPSLFDALETEELASA